MANTYNTLGELFTAIANAIRAKKKSSGDIVADNFPEEIGAIETPELQSKTVSPTTSDQTIVPDVGYNGLLSITVEGMNLQSKTVIPATEQQTVSADEGYDGLSQVIVEAAETGGDGNSPEAELALTLWSERSGATSLTYMFSQCHSLTTVPLFDTSKVTNMSYMFEGCTSLTTVPLFDTRNVTSITNMSKMFYNCYKLTNCYLRNIKVNLQVGSGTSYGHLLTLDSLIHLIKELRDTGSSKTLTVGSANLEKLANVYVRTIDITDEMRVEDDLIDEKLPFEVCESTDEGAMLITAYVLEKHWTLK